MLVPKEPDDALAALANHASHTPGQTLQGRTWTTGTNDDASDFRAGDRMGQIRFEDDQLGGLQV
ncbi:hypothetical protein JCM24511_03360 [Saitozyma sp. JCM 24511]|nr:hypothetical protein JCM24511_03360 [Saitozyma sp. JCM 24511]